jgi:phosphate transport system protein
MQRLADELARLKERVIAMGDTVESMVVWAGNALIDRHPESIRRVSDGELRVDQFQIEIDQEAIRLITVYTPIARDLRFLLMVARINSELERIGDQSLNNCEYIQQLPPNPRPRAFGDLSRMAEITRGMVRDALLTFKDEDITRAQRVVETDDRVDELYVQTFRDLLTAGSDANVVNESMTMILLARSLERIADHATNICEEIFYLVKAEDIRHRYGVLRQDINGPERPD